MKYLFLRSTVVISAVLTLSACHFDKSKPNFDLIQDFMVSPALKAQAYYEDGPNHSSVREPAKGTVPVGFVSEPLDDLAVAEREMKNPMVGDFSKDVLLAGQKYYQVQCALCHGAKGEGGVESKSLIAEKMALKPPSLLSEKVLGWSDVHIYYVISKGQGLMGQYATHIPQKYRWQVVNYIRHLQKNNKK